MERPDPSIFTKTNACECSSFLKEYRISKVVHSDSEKESVNMLAMFGFPNQETEDSRISLLRYPHFKKIATL